MKEHQHIEWKESWRDEYLKWICGFANAEGGVLVIGRNNKGVPAKVPEPGLRYEQSGLWIEFWFPKAVKKTMVETRVETRVETPGKILDYLLVNPNASLAEVATAIGKSLSAVERASSKLVKENKLRFIGPRKRGHWEVLKYKMTKAKTETRKEKKKRGQPAEQAEIISRSLKNKGRLRV